VTLAGLDPLLAIPAAGCLAAIVAAVLGPLMFRLEGPYFAIGSWVVAEALRLGCAQFKPLGGGTGISLSSAALASMTGTKSVAAQRRRTNRSHTLLAVGDRRLRDRHVGALIYLQKARISPDAAFSVVDWTAYVLFVVVIGGVRTIEGPMVGVLVFWALQYNLSGYRSLYLLVLGLIAILVMLFMQRGIWGSIAARWNLQFFAVRKLLTRDDS
jgi:branched-chain amino acid transport system permease protein